MEIFEKSSVTVTTYQLKASFVETPTLINTLPLRSCYMGILQALASLIFSANARRQLFEELNKGAALGLADHIQAGGTA